MDGTALGGICANVLKSDRWTEGFSAFCWERAMHCHAAISCAFFPFISQLQPIDIERSFFLYNPISVHFESFGDIR